jgi:hypothetical protein
VSTSKSIRDKVTSTSELQQFRAYVKSIEEILTTNLQIPAYQRPYTWTVKNVDQLISDIQHFRSSGHYRLGTFILNPAPSSEPAHHSNTEEQVLDIVDGQQRYLTFGLIILALSNRTDELESILAKSLKSRMREIRIPTRNDGQSEKNLQENYAHLQQIILGWTSQELSDFTEFFLKECSVVVLEVYDLDAAFQLFDSQNTRGKALYPTDLLKAYHLREFRQTAASREAILETVRRWDAIDPEEIEHLFAAVLFPIKRWSTYLPVPVNGFTSEHVDLFKGIREGKTQYRWAQTTLMAKATVDRYREDNETLRRYGVVNEFEFPFQILQPILDGEMFFRMVEHYIGEARKAGVTRVPTKQSKSRDFQPAQELSDLLTLLDNIPAGTGNRYIRELFDCLLMAYLDRFGWHETRQAATRLAKYAFMLRIELDRVNKQSINNHALGTHNRIQKTHENLFAKIGLAQSPAIILTRSPDLVTLDKLAKRDEIFYDLYANESPGSVTEETTP